jgi:hypothetical protein
MAGYTVPTRVWFVDAFPVPPSTNAARIQRGEPRWILRRPEVSIVTKRPGGVAAPPIEW